MDVSRQVGWRPDAYAGFWQRVGGYLVDGLLITAVLLVASLVLAVAVGGGTQARTAQNWVSWLGILAVFAYDTVLTHRYGATLGKRAAGIEVRRPDGTLPSYGVCVGRYFARFLSFLGLLIGFLWPVFDPKKQTWHDKIVDTFVIRRADIVRTAEDGQTAATAPASAAAPERPREPARSTGGVPGRGPGGTRPAGDPDAAPPRRDRPPAPNGGGPVGATMETARWGMPAPEAHEPSSSQPPPAPAAPAEPAPAQPVTAGPEPVRPAPTAHGADERGRVPDEERPDRTDPNLVAIERAGLAPESAQWLRQVAQQVDPRLDRVTSTWRRSPQADAARACAFGILLGHLARVHRHMAPDLGKVAEVHPSFSTLLAGSRLSTLEQIAAEPGRATAWLGPLIDVEDRERVAQLLA